MSAETDLILHRIEQLEAHGLRVEAKLDRVLETHIGRIDALESFRDRQQARQPIYQALGLGVLGLALKELWGLVAGTV